MSQFLQSKEVISARPELKSAYDKIALDLRLIEELTSKLNIVPKKVDDDQVKNVARIEGLKTKSDNRETLVNEIAKKRRLDQNLIEDKKSTSSSRKI